MKKLYVFALVLALSLVMSVSLFASNYTPLPGVLGPEDVDFGGETVMIFGLNLNPNAARVFVGWDNYEPELFLARVAEAEELFNVNIIGRLGANSNLITNRILAGDSVNDIYVEPHREISYFNLVSEDYLYPVGEFLSQDYYDSLSNVDRSISEKLRYQNEFYTFGSIMGPINDSMMFTVYNKDIFEEENQPDPYELWLDGEWTWETFEEIAKELTRDTNGDGNIDQRGYYAIQDYAVWRFGASNAGVELTRFEEDGSVVFNYDSPVAINTLNTFQRWMNEEEFLGEGNVMWDSHIAGIRHDKASGNFEYGIVPMPKGPDGDRHYYPAFSFHSAAIPANAENPQGLVALFEFLFRPDDWEMRWDPALDHLMDIAITSREQWDVVMTAAEEWQGEGDHFQYMGLWDIVLDHTNEVVAGEVGAASAMRSVAPEAQAYLDDLFKQ
ncbi:ABC transporter substrate-binding protein [Natronospora cellulosivora (SeqCode)]